jgi:hypothetical protein
MFKWILYSAEFFPYFSWKKKGEDDRGKEHGRQGGVVREGGSGRVRSKV